MTKILKTCLPLLVMALLSCGGGSTVTSVSLTAANTEVPLGGSTEITAKSETSITENVTGEKVHFAFRTNESGGRLDVINDRLDGNKEAKAIYHAGTRPGNDVLQSSFDSGAVATVTIRVGTGVPVAPLEISQIGTNRVRVMVRDPRGIPIEGANVDLSISIGSITPTSGTTNANGIVEATFELPAGVTSARVTATVQGVSATATVSTADTSVARINLSQRGEFVQATAYDRSGRPVPNVLINFSIRAGTVTPSSGETNANGILETRFELPAGVNSTTLVATSGGVSATITVNRVPTQVALIRLEQFGTQILATALDGSNTPVPRILINFRITSGTISQTAETNTNGLAEATFTLPAGVNTARVLASHGTVSATLDVVRPDPPATGGEMPRNLTRSSDTQPASSIRLDIEGHAVRAWLADSKGTPVEGAMIAFSISEGSVQDRHVLTNVNGVAETAFTLPATALAPVLTAEGSGVSASLPVR